MSKDTATQEECANDFYARLAAVQAALKAPKDLDNKFGGYKYRNAESILMAAKPLLAAAGLAINLTDEIVIVGDRYYLRARASITDGENTAEATAWAREPLSKKGMDDSQVTGSASSYARKYALSGLFGIDDSTADPDNPDNHPDNPETQKREAALRPKGKGTQPAPQSAPQPAPRAAPQGKDDATIKAELAEVENLADLMAYYQRHKGDIAAIKGALSARKGELIANIRAAVDNVRTVAELDALREATPGVDLYAEVKAMFDGTRKSMAEVEAVM